MMPTSVQSLSARPGEARAGDGRRLTDRRRNTPRAMVCALFMNRRQGPRRAADAARPGYVDCHPPHAHVLLVATVLLCCADAFFTLILLQHGGEEVNPLMHALITHDVQTFIVVKYAITAVALFLAVLHSNFRLFRAITGYHILYGAFAGYLVLVKYEVALLIVNGVAI